MRYALKLAEDGRVLSSTYEKFATEGMPLVDSIPDDNISDYRYIDDKFISDPLPEPEQKPSQFDIIDARLTYVEMMTGLLQEV